MLTTGVNNPNHKAENHIRQKEDQITGQGTCFKTGLVLPLNPLMLFNFVAINVRI